MLEQERERERRQAEAEREEQRRREKEKAEAAERAAEAAAEAEQQRREEERAREARLKAEQQRLEEQRAQAARLRAEEEEAARREQAEEEARARVRANQAILAARSGKADLTKVPVHQRPPTSAAEDDELLALADGVEKQEGGRRVASDPKAAKLLGRTCVWSDKLMATVRFAVPLSLAGLWARPSLRLGSGWAWSCEGRGARLTGAWTTLCTLSVRHVTASSRRRTRSRF